MCGIIGINRRDEKLVRSSAECFRYRGPDASAFFSDARVTLGHHRLAIVDLDPRSIQPMSDADGKVWIIFNGEIFNFKDVKAKLAAKYSFRTESDTEVLIYAYKEWGRDMTRHIEGMFALAIYDVGKQTMLLMRDHEGIKPLYYYAKDGLFAFASELKGVASLLRQKDVLLSIDKKALDLYLVFGYMPSPYTLYEGISKLEKGSYLEYDLKKGEIASAGRYETVFAKASTVEEYRQLIERKVLSHLIADVPVGVFFSGGTDSSLIAAILHRHKVDLQAFSIQLDYKTEDAKYFSQISRHLGIKSHVYAFDVSTLDSIYEEVMGKVDEPSYDNSIFPTYYVSKKASEKVKVVLSGEGGDELFYGYPRSLELWKMGDKVDDSITLLDRLYISLPSFRAKNRLFQKLFRLFKRPISYYLLSMSVLRDRATVSQWKVAKEECRRRGMRPMGLDRELYLEGDLLRKTDFATSYASIEGRVPLLDIDIVGNAVATGGFEETKLKGGVTKAFLKDMLATYIPANLVYRSKSGFGVDMVAVFAQSTMLRADLDKAIEYLKDRGVYTLPVRDTGLLIRRYPHLAFATISLYRSLLNTGY